MHEFPHTFSPYPFLARGFAEFKHRGDYEVFQAPYSNANGLVVAAKIEKACGGIQNEGLGQIARRSFSRLSESDLHSSEHVRSVSPNHAATLHRRFKIDVDSLRSFRQRERETLNALFCHENCTMQYAPLLLQSPKFKLLSRDY